MWQNLEISVSVVRSIIFLINKAAADICRSHRLMVTQSLFSSRHRVSLLCVEGCRHCAVYMFL